MDKITKIKELRLREGLTQNELSQRTNLSLRTIQRIENGEVKPTAYSLRIIGEVLQEDFNEKHCSSDKNNFIDQIKMMDKRPVLVSFMLAFVIAFCAVYFL